MPRALVLADAAYSNDIGFRDGLHELGLEYAVLVATAKLRWRIERDYEELKQELGLGTSKDGTA